MISPGPALQEGAVDDQLGRGIQILHRRHVLLKNLGDQGRVGADDAGDGGLRDAVDLGEQLLGQVVPQVGQGQAHTQEHPPAPSPRTPAGDRKRKCLAQVQDLAAGDSRATIRHGGLLLDWIGLDTKDSLKSKPPPYLTTHTPFKHPKRPYE